MNFCPDCENMLYLKIENSDELEPDPESELEEEGCAKQKPKSKGLIYFCKSCGKEFDNLHDTQQSVYSIDYNIDSIQKHTLINEYTLEDPTLPKATGIKCPNLECISKTTKQPNIVYINYDDTDMKYIYACLDCYKQKVEPHIW
jgi:DNA-directed RNA polymerase subunit M/transcription elongation factor TFIIS